MRITSLPTKKSGCSEAATQASLPPTMIAPSATGAASDGASLMRPRRYGSNDKYKVRSRSGPAAGAAAAI